MLGEMGVVKGETDIVFDDAETFANRADALTAYERLIRDSRTCADDPPVKA